MNFRGYPENYCTFLQTMLYLICNISHIAQHYRDRQNETDTSGGERAAPRGREKEVSYMNECFKAVHLSHGSAGLEPVKRFGYENAQKVQAFHASFPEYAPTPLVSLDGLAGKLGLGNLYVRGVISDVAKDEALMRDMKIPAGFTPVASVAAGYAASPAAPRKVPANDVTKIDFVN